MTSEEHGSCDNQQDHIEFIQSIIQLKTVLKICNPLSKAQFTNILQNFPHICRYDLDRGFRNDVGSEPSEELFSSEEHTDSGFSSMSSPFTPEESVPNSTVSYVVRSSLVQKQIRESIYWLLQHLYSCFFERSPDELEGFVNKWKDSVLESAVNVIVELNETSVGEEPDYFVYCVDFIKAICDEIYASESTVPYTHLENQCVLVIELCKCQRLCEILLQYILDKVFNYVQNAKPIRNSVWCPERTSIGDPSYDNLFYMLYLLQELVKSYKPKDEASSNVTTPYTAVLEMWKESWHIPGNEEVVRESPVQQWTSTLQDIVTRTMQDFPNVSYMAWCTLKKLELKSKPMSGQQSSG